MHTGHTISDTKHEFERVKEQVDLQIQSRENQLKSDKKSKILQQQMQTILERMISLK